MPRGRLEAERELLGGPSVGGRPGFVLEDTKANINLGGLRGRGMTRPEIFSQLGRSVGDKDKLMMGCLNSLSEFLWTSRWNSMNSHILDIRHSFKESSLALHHHNTKIMLGI